MGRFRDIKVMLRSPDGQYLAGGPTEWEFSGNPEDAAVFNYLADEIETLLERIHNSHGIDLEAVHVAATGLCETCDRCKETVLPTIAYFNGKLFLCPDCSRATLSRLAA